MDQIYYIILTDLCQGIITQILDDGHRLVPDALTGGADNVFAVGNTYQVLDGAKLDSIVRRFELAITAQSTSSVSLVVNRPR